MPSPAERRWWEAGGRAVAIVALGALLWRAWRLPMDGDPSIDVAQARALPAALARATDAPARRLDLSLDSLPGQRERDWARAVAGAGTEVRWSLAASASPVAAVVEPLADPAGRARLSVSAATGTTVTVRDEAGVLDSAALASAGVRTLDVTVEGAARVQARSGEAVAAARDSVVLRPVLVIARAGWEGKFVVAALEEAGWRVDARFRVAPDADVRQGGGGAIDTARYAAVIALDESAASNALSLARFVREGGGAIVAPAAARSPALAAILPARLGDPVPPRFGALASAEPRRALGGVALTGINADAVVLERSGGRARVVAARADAGRVVMLGYDETWRWRMEGDDGAPAAHRAWWSSLVASVAYAPLVQLAEAPAGDESPYASLVEALGPPAPRAAMNTSGGAALPWERILFAIFLASLLAEWASRRLRAAR